jgi:hypothetical protein
LRTKFTTNYFGNKRPYWANGVDLGAFELPEATFRIGAEGVQPNFPVTHTIEIVNESAYWERTQNGYVLSSDNELETSTYISEGNISNLNHIDEMDGFHFKWMKKETTGPESPMGRGFYKISNDLDPTKYFYLDLRDGSVEYNPNIYIRFFNGQELKEYQFYDEGWSNNSIAQGAIKRIWDLANGSYNTLDLDQYWAKALLWFEEREYVKLVWGPYPAEENETVSGYNLYMDYHLFEDPPGNNWELLYSAGSTEYDYPDERRTPGNGDYAMSYEVRAVVDNAEIESNTVTVRLIDLAKEKSKESLNKFEYLLHQNYPNPFNPSTNISFSIKRDGIVTLKVFDILGREVTTLVDEQLKAGQHSVNFNGRGLASGIYFYKLTTGEFSSVKKLQLLK